MAGAAVEVVALRGLGIGRTVQAVLERSDLADSRATPAATSARSVLLERGEPPTSVASYRFSDLQPGHRIVGPALLDDVDTTVWVPPMSTASIDAYRSTVVELSV
jgi:N-methylhydantoinase A